ncbi:MAG: hypothetical protein CO093_07640 [Alphaproteobacteria bacterium CG_4_9_14_3_um_filter_47_13]|nr:MAG: hypothetical protein CO093_07640 [Alphaproteobacteria bacterium CG_4_9_14_3_um_filter_47_13]
MKKMGGTSKIAAAFLLAALALPFSSGVLAQNQDQAQQQTIEAISNTTLAYIKTGNENLDRMSAAGLSGLGRQLYRRTGVQNVQITRDDNNMPVISTSQVMVVGVDPAKDDLSVYPFIYWPIDPDQKALSSEALKNLNAYMNKGGQALIDTRDQSTGGRGEAWLQQAVKDGLDIPALEKVEGCVLKAQKKGADKPCHSLGKSFFLLDSFPGRYAGGVLWAEKTETYRSDGVASVLIGGSEWAAAWATDTEGNYMFPVTGGNPEQREYAFRAGINMVMYALTGNYKNEVIHTPTLDKRLKPASLDKF